MKKPTRKKAPPPPPEAPFVPSHVRQAVALERIATALDTIANLMHYWHTAANKAILQVMKDRS